MTWNRLSRSDQMSLQARNGSIEELTVAAVNGRGWGIVQPQLIEPRRTDDSIALDRWWRVFE